MRGVLVGGLLVGALLAGCAPESAPSGTPTSDADAVTTPAPLAVSPDCHAADPGAASAHLVAASVVRASLLLGESEVLWDAALTALADRQAACLAAASAAGPNPTAPARALRAALLRDMALERVDRGGLPPLWWRLLEDGASRAAHRLPAVDAALDDPARLGEAHAVLVELQRHRIEGLPEVMRFLDETGRTALVADRTWVAWLGVAP